MDILKFELKEINSRDFFGSNDIYLNKLQSLFPEIKIVTRGDFIKVQGQSSILRDFQNSFQSIIEYWQEYQQLSTEIIESLVLSNRKGITKSSSPHNYILHRADGGMIFTKNSNQYKIVQGIEKKDMLFAIGPAGTGKTFISVALAVRSLRTKNIKKIILTRPAVEAGENLGFLPGDLKEKLDPYMQPLYDALLELIPKDKLDYYIKNKTVQIAPLAFMRGRTLNDAFVILDEAQNTNPMQMKMFLTRMGKNSKFIITGDPEQIDLPLSINSGLKHVMELLKSIEEIEFIYLNTKDVVRHQLVTKIIDLYQNKK